MTDVLFMHGGGADSASYRYRVETPAKYLNKNGYNVNINGGNTDKIIVFRS